MSEALDKVYGAGVEELLVRACLFNGTLDVPPLLLVDEDLRELRKLHGELGTSATPTTLMHELLRRRNSLPETAPKRDLLTRVLKRLRTLCKKGNLSTADLQYVGKHYHEFIVRQEMLRALEGGAADWSQGNYDAILKRITEARDRAERHAVIDLGFLYSDPKLHLTRYIRSRKRIHGIPTGFTHLDGLMFGGMKRGKIGVILAPPGRGKTMTLVNIGANALTVGNSVVHVSIGDLDEVEAGYRYDARLTGIPANAIAKNPMLHKSKLLRAIGKLRGHLFIKEYGSNEVCVTDIRRYVQSVQKHCVSKGLRPPSLLIVDYLNIVRPEGKSSNGEELRYKDVGSVVMGLRQLGKDLRMGVWTATQTNRKGLSAKVLSWDDSWEPFEPAQHCDVGIGLCQTHTEKTRGKMRLVLMKNRLGGHEGTIIDCDVDTDAQSMFESRVQASSAAVVY